MIEMTLMGTMLVVLFLYMSIGEDVENMITKGKN
jgi:hypothetical protein